MHRKKALYKLVEHNKPTSIVEVGTWNGVNALSMCSIALNFHKEVTYYGFDLFETATAENDEKELNVKAHANYNDVVALFEDFKKSHPGFNYYLFCGNSNDALFNAKMGDDSQPWRTADFAFIDGGHAVETIAKDYEALKDCRTIVFDDLYLPDEKGVCVDINKFGCNKVVDQLNGARIPIGDRNNLGGLIGIYITPANHSPFPVQLKVETRNCVDNKQAQANVKYSTAVHDKWIPACNRHDNTAVMVSAGPSYLGHLDELREYSKRPDHFIFCVKTNHNELIEHGIVPFGCILLDPRPKVKRFIKPHKDVNYFAASIVHPSTIDLLHEYNLFLYNAPIGAGEQDLYGTASKDPRSKRLVGGGTTAAGRAIPLLRVMGFLTMKLYGYDSCYKDPQDHNATTKDGQKKFWEIEKYGKKFWTSLELLAQVQDFEKYFGAVVGDPSFDIEFIGDGMIPWIYKHVQLSRENFTREMFNGCDNVPNPS